MPGIFTSVMTHMASVRPGHASAASAEENTSGRQPRSSSICPIEWRAASSSSITTMVGLSAFSRPAITRSRHRGCRAES